MTVLSYGAYSDASVIKINRDDTYIVDESGDISKMFPSPDMQCLVRDSITEEQSKFLETNAGKPIKTWYNLKQVHKIEVIEIGFNYYVKIYFAPFEWYFIESFDCEKAANRYIKDLFSE